MKIGVLLSFLNFISCINKMTPSETKEVALVGSNYTIICNIEEKYPTWIWVYNDTHDEVIANSGSSEIGPDYHARERIEYDTNNRDIILYDVSMGDAGKYVCSFAAGNKKPARRSDLHLDVDDFGVEDFECPKEDFGEFSVTTTCVTQDAVQAEWFFVSTDDNRKIRDVNAITIYDNTTCSSGKGRITSRSFYKPSKTFIKNEVHIMLRLSFSVENTSDKIIKKCSEQTYYIDGSCDLEYLLSLLGLSTSIPLLICAFYYCCKDRDARDYNSPLLFLAFFFHLVSLLSSIVTIVDILVRDKCLPEMNNTNVYITVCLPIATWCFGAHYLFFLCTHDIQKKRSRCLEIIRRTDVTRINSTLNDQQ